MTLSAVKSRLCPRCGSSGFKAIESKKTAEGRRRRYRCKECDYRETTYEIAGPAYEELVELRRILRDVRGLVAPGGTTETEGPSKHIICYSCDHYSAHGCGFGYPEAGTLDAKGCFNYETKQ